MAPGVPRGRDRSFPFYLVHLPIIYAVGPRVYGELRDTDVGLQLALILTFAAAAVASVAAAELFLRLVDRPAVALARRIDAWLRA